MMFQVREEFENDADFLADYSVNGKKSETAAPSA
jgi:hypothetical protein